MAAPPSAGLSQRFRGSDGRVNHFLRLLRYGAPYRSRLIAALVAMLLYGAASGLLAYLIKPIFDEVLVKNLSQDRVMEIGLLVIIASLVKGIGAYFSAFLMTDVGQLVVRDVRNELFAHTLGQSAGFFARRTSGQLMSRITG